MSRKRILEKQDIIDAGLIIIRTEGAASFNARRLAEELQTTTSPIFGFYRTLDDLLADIWDAAMHQCEQYLLEALDYSPFFKEFGLRYIGLALDEPLLFKFVFLPGSIRGEHKSKCRAELFEVFRPIRNALKEHFDLDEAEADEFMHCMMIFAGGFAMMSLNESEKPGRAEISLMLTKCCDAVIECIKKNKGKVNRENYEQMSADNFNFPSLREK